MSHVEHLAAVLKAAERHAETIRGAGNEHPFDSPQRAEGNAAYGKLLEAIDTVRPLVEKAEGYDRAAAAFDADRADMAVDPTRMFFVNEARPGFAFDDRGRPFGIMKLTGMHGGFDDRVAVVAFLGPDAVNAGAELAGWGVAACSFGDALALDRNIEAVRRAWKETVKDQARTLKEAVRAPEPEA